MFKKIIAVLLMFSIVLSSCGKKDKDKSNDFVRVVPESSAPAETPTPASVPVETSTPAESPAPPPTVPAPVATPASESPAPTSATTTPPVPVETSTPAEPPALVKSPESLTPAEPPTLVKSPKSSTSAPAGTRTPTICDRLPLCPSVRDSRFMYYWTYDMFYIRGFAITPNNVFWTLFVPYIGFKMPILRWWHFYHRIEHNLIDSDNIYDWLRARYMRYYLRRRSNLHGNEILFYLLRMFCCMRNYP